MSRIGVLVAAVLIASLSVAANPAPQDTPSAGKPARGSTQTSPAKAFADGEAALGRGDLDEAERNFKRVLAIDPRAGSAHANLGVIYMRRQQWEVAVTELRKAEKLSPQVAGIRLNIALVYYRQSDFWHAIPPLESVVKEQPSSMQARTLLGQCYFFTERWVEAVDVLEPMWEQQNRDLNYLYVLGIAADRAERSDLGDRALVRLVEVGGDSPEVHLLVGKAKLNEEAYDDALKELQVAADADPHLPFVHFNLGLTHMKKGEYDQAKLEFEKDMAVEPDVAFNYSELGNLFFLKGNDGESEKFYREALRLDPHLEEAVLGLAKVYQRQGRLEKALAELDTAAKLDPSSRIHYLRGQVLLRMGRKEEGRKELETSVNLSKTKRDQREKELEAEPVPNPELTQDAK